MAEVLVVADDLTGSNATGALFARRGLRAVTVGDVRHAVRHAATADVVVVNIGTRHARPTDARAAAGDAVGALSDVRLVVKRVDTTLRGNVGAELEGALDVMRARHSRVRALCVPAFPAAGRTTVGGVHLVDGVPLAETEAARDPFTPVTTSHVATLLGRQSDLTVAEVALDLVQADHQALVGGLRSETDVLVCDTVTPAHLTALARAAAAVARADGVNWLSVDSGPFGAALAAALRITHPRHRPRRRSADARGARGARGVGGVGGRWLRSLRPARRVLGAGGRARPVLVVAGSITARTKDQLIETERVLRARYVDIRAADIDVRTLCDQIIGLLDDGAPIVGLRMAADDRVDAALAVRIPRALGEVTRRTIGRVGGVYATGGDVSVGVVAALGAEGFAIEAEVRPLAVAGRLVGGPHHGLPFAVKGGLIGDRSAAVDCIEHLRMAAGRTRVTKRIRRNPP